MRQCNLSYKACYRMIKTLSKGHHQRVRIVDAMLKNNKIISPDESTLGLAQHQVISVRKINDTNMGTRTI
jgi:ABC-type multidrug transport system ATPase subunit